jgi:hypothetical protein
VRPPSIDFKKSPLTSRADCTVVACVSSFFVPHGSALSPSPTPFAFDFVCARLYPSKCFQRPYASHKLERMERTACGDEDTRASAGVFSSFKFYPLLS